MGEQGELGFTDDAAASPRSAMARRRLLQAAAAAGAGAVAWSAPDITSLGSTPAYAEHCSCLGVPVEYVSAHTGTVSCPTPSSGVCGGLRIRLLGTVTVGPGYTAEVESNGCADGTRMLELQYQGARCRVTLQLYNRAGVLQEEYFLGEGGGIVPVITQGNGRCPTVGVPNSGGWTWGVKILCVPGRQCFPDEIH